MNMPGFTAEASFYRTRERYLKAKIPASTKDSGKVVLQA